MANAKENVGAGRADGIALGGDGQAEEGIGEQAAGPQARTPRRESDAV